MVSEQRKKTGVVIIDPEARADNFYSSLFDLERFDLFIGISLENGIRLVSAHHPEVVIVDDDPAGRPALETLEQLRALSPKACYGIVTANPSHDFVVKTIQQGVAFYFTKRSANLPALRKRIDHALEQSKRETAMQQSLNELKERTARLKEQVRAMENSKRPPA